MTAEYVRPHDKNYLPKRRIINLLLHKSETSKRLMIALNVNLAPFVRNIYVEGEANLDKIPKNVPIIFAMTHATNDVEMQSGMVVVGKRFDTVITNNSSHHSLEDPIHFSL